MSDYSDRLREALEDIRTHPHLSAADIAEEALAIQNPNAIEVEIVIQADGRYDVRCHGANGIATIYGRTSLADALRSLEDWCASQAQSRETSIA